MAKKMSIEVHNSKDGMAVVMNKHALNSIKEGRVGQVNLTSGKGTIVLQLMRDSTFRQLRAEQARSQEIAAEAARLAMEKRGEEKPAESAK